MEVYPGEGAWGIEDQLGPIKAYPGEGAGDIEDQLGPMEAYNRRHRGTHGARSVTLKPWNLTLEPWTLILEIQKFDLEH
jgi:hypothetical protein